LAPAFFFHQKLMIAGGLLELSKPYGILLNQQGNCLELN
jgi:hypothetical protein